MCCISRGQGVQSDSGSQQLLYIRNMSSCTPAAKKILDAIMAEKGNNRCIDCGSKLSVDWASVNLGVFFCIDCSGRHRSFGVHISFVRSITMDKWDMWEKNLIT